MKKIKEIKIQNFKAFQKEQVFPINGKNVLVYGNNGSGKSSLFWALYTFLQSSIKTSDDEIRKYFLNFDEGNQLTNQSLKNIFAQEEDDAFIELKISENAGVSQSIRIDQNSFPTRPENNGNDTMVQELNLASDFINYKLLHNFYNASHKQEINLWPVFEKDIFPFMTRGITNWMDYIKKHST
jgi:AAA15 family ATPase/GTPase